MGYELSRDVLRASHLVRELTGEPVTSPRHLACGPGSDVPANTGGVYSRSSTRPILVCSSCRPSNSSVGTCASVAAAVFEAIEPSFRRAATASESIVIGYELPMPEGPRMYEARLVRNDNDQILTLVRDVTDASAPIWPCARTRPSCKPSPREPGSRRTPDRAQEASERASGASSTNDLSQEIAGLSIALSRLKRRLSAFR